MPASLVKVPERGSTGVDNATWAALESEPAFWALVARGILGVSQVGARKYRISAGPFVGRVTMNKLSLEITEKIPGALPSLLSFATAGAFRLEQVPHARTELGPLLALLIREFVTAVRLYASGGRERVYVTRPTRSSLVSGRLNLPESIALRARGMRHVVAFDRTVLTANTPKNRVLLAALREVELLARIMPIEEPVVFQARAVSGLFSDCLTAEVLAPVRNAIVAEAEGLRRDPRHRREADLLSLASVVLSNESFEYGRATIGTAPRSWFVSLETLFERAVRTVLADLGRRSLVVRGADVPRYLFPPARVRVFPDLVITEGGACIAIGDTKYKKWKKRTRRGDLYQVLAHTAAYGAPRAFLIIPGDHYQEQFVGRAATGADTWVFRVDVLDLRRSLELALTRMGMGTSIAA